MALTSRGRPDAELFEPPAGPSSGGDIVRLAGTSIAESFRALFGGALVKVLSVRDEAGLRVAGVRTPVHLGEHAEPAGHSRTGGHR